MFQHKKRKLLPFFLTVEVLTISLFTTIFIETSFTNIVYANTPGGNDDSRTVTFNMQISAGPMLGGRYNSMLHQLREAAGDQFGTNRYSYSLITQSNEHGLVFLDITLPTNHTVRLIFTASDMYLRGFRNSQGEVFQFNERFNGNQTLANRLGLEPANPHYQYPHTLSFNGTYPRLQTAANIDRRHVSISYNSIINALETLANYRGPNSTNSVTIARSLLLIIQWTSEAARFRPIQNVMLRALGDSTHSITLNDHQVELENNWDFLSGAAQDFTRHPEARPSVRAGRTFRTLTDVLNVVFLLKHRGR